ncbi:hypothetical protein RFI_30869, partial [Reticulomyxa filosa]
KKKKKKKKKKKVFVVSETYMHVYIHTYKCTNHYLFLSPPSLPFFFFIYTIHCSGVAALESFLNLKYVHFQSRFLHEILIPKVDIIFAHSHGLDLMKCAFRCLDINALNPLAKIIDHKNNKHWTNALMSIVQERSMAKQAMLQQQHQQQKQQISSNSVPPFLV